MALPAVQHCAKVVAERAAAASAAVRRRVALDERGVAAVEFALILPVMLTLYIGSVEVSQALSVDRKIVLLTRTLADLTTQNASVTAVADGTSSSIVSISGASSVVLAPVSTTGLRMRLTSVGFSAPKSGTTNDATACWSWANAAWTAHARGKVFTSTEVPTSLRGDVNTSVVMAEVEYPYKPVIGYVLTGTLNLNERIFMRPRLVAYVERKDLANKGLPSPSPGPCT